jgi:hypothetical protein
MNIKVGRYVSIWNMFLEAILTHYTVLRNGPTVHTTTGTWYDDTPLGSPNGHHSLKLAVNLILDIWGSSVFIVSL